MIKDEEGRIIVTKSITFNTDKKINKSCITYENNGNVDFSSCFTMRSNDREDDLIIEDLKKHGIY